MPSSVEASSDLRVAVLIGLAIFLFTLPFHRGHFVGGDELSVYETTRSLAEEGKLSVPPLPYTHFGRGGHTFQDQSDRR